MQLERLHFRDPLSRAPRDTSVAGREQRFYEQHANDSWNNLRKTTEAGANRIARAIRRGFLSLRADILARLGERGA